MRINYDDINTLSDLQLQIQLLKEDYTQRGILLKDDTRHYLQQFTPSNLIKKYATPANFVKLDEKTHISGKIMSVVLPLLLNRTVFKGSGFLTKTLATFISGKVGRSLDTEHLTGVFNVVKSLFKGKGKKKSAFVDYGIPPDSETY